MVRRLNEVSAEGLEVLSYRELPETAKNAMSLVAAADYTFWFKEGFAPEDGSSVEEFFGKFLTFCKNETIPFVKQTKKGERTVDLRPLICEARIAERKEYVPAMVADWYRIWKMRRLRRKNRQKESVSSCASYRAVRQTESRSRYCRHSMRAWG